MWPSALHTKRRLLSFYNELISKVGAIYGTQTVYLRDRLKNKFTKNIDFSLWVNHSITCTHIIYCSHFSFLAHYAFRSYYEKIVTLIFLHRVHKVFVFRSLMRSEEKSGWEIQNQLLFSSVNTTALNSLRIFRNSLEVIWIILYFVLYI